MADKKIDKQKQMKSLIQKLQDGTKGIYEEDNFKKYLNVVSKFYNYSSRNISLIALQNPNASHVAGFNAWKKNFNRNVKKGEKGIKIIMPIISKEEKKEKDNKEENNKEKEDEGKKEEEKFIKGFKIGYVYDISQTEGKPLPELLSEIKDEVRNYNEFYKVLESISPYNIKFKDIDTGEKGSCNYTNKEIIIKNNMSESQTIKTLIHEIAHAKLHENNNKDKNIEEIEAESIAYVTSNYFGVDTSDYSFKYVAVWSSGKDLKELQGSLDTIQKESKDLIDKIESKFKEVDKRNQNKCSIEDKVSKAKEKSLNHNQEIKKTSKNKDQER